MKKIICLAAALLLLALALTGCHKHVSAAPATCTEPEICTECGKVMTEALGHDPGPEATCAAPQTCRRCGIELSPQLPHTSAGPLHGGRGLCGVRRGHQPCAGSHGRGGRRVHYLRTAGGSGRTAVHRTR